MDGAPFQGAHNNLVERQIRPLVVGRKNHYGSKSKRGTEVAALFYSLIETAQLRGGDPAVYLQRAAMACHRYARHGHAANGGRADEDRRRQSFRPPGVRARSYEEGGAYCAQPS